MDLLEVLSVKGADLSVVAQSAIEEPGLICELIAGVSAPKGTVRYAFEKVLRQISEQRPELLLPHFDVFVHMLDHENSFLKWGAIMTLANLIAVDSQKRFDAVFERYYSPISGPSMISAANIIGASVKIVQYRPDLAGRVFREILNVEHAEYKSKGQPSPECRNVAIGQAVDTFDQVYEIGACKDSIAAFVKRQLSNPRSAVVKKAEKFIQAHLG